VGLFEPKWQKEKGNQLTNRPQIGGRNQRGLSTDPNAESIAGDDRATRRNRIEEEPARGGEGRDGGEPAAVRQRDAGAVLRRDVRPRPRRRRVPR
jgi:hypothetical protein